MKTNRLNLRISDERKAQLEALASQRRMTVQATVDMAIESLLESDSIPALWGDKLLTAGETPLTQMVKAPESQKKKSTRRPATKADKKEAERQARQSLCPHRVPASSYCPRCDG